MSENTQVTVLNESELTRYMMKAAPSLKALLPPGSSIVPEKIIRMALMDVAQSDLLMKASPRSILIAITHAASLGLHIGPFLGESYIVPFKGNATLIPGYKGLSKLAMQGLSISSIAARLVYKDDEFDVRYGTSPEIIHRPNWKGARKDEDIIGAYMVADIRGEGRPFFEVMTLDEINKRREASKSKDLPDSPWKKWFPEQVKKTAVRYGVKLLPASSDPAAFERLNAGVELDNRYEVGHVTAPNEVLDRDMNATMSADLAERTRESSENLTERLKKSRATATAKVAADPNAKLSDEENAALDRKIAEEDK